MYERMTHDHGYSVRRLAQKLGKDKGYIENRLRLADAPTEIKQLVSLRKDTLSHAYELLKVEDPKKRRKLAEQVARGELSPGQAAREDRRPAGTRAVRAACRSTSRGRGRGGAASTDARRGPDRRRRADLGQGQPCRCARPAGRPAGRARRAVADRRHRPGEPGQVPDDRQAAPRERHNRRPLRQAARELARSAGRPGSQPGPAAPGQPPGSSSRLLAVAGRLSWADSVTASAASSEATTRGTIGANPATDRSPAAATPARGSSVARRDGNDRAAAGRVAPPGCAGPPRCRARGLKDHSTKRSAARRGRPAAAGTRGEAAGRRPRRTRRRSARS